MMSDKDSSLILTAKDVEKIIRKYGLNELMDELISRLNSAILHYNSEKTIIPVRSGFQYNRPHNGLIEWMPLLNKEDKVMMKVVGYHPCNPIMGGLPTILSTISAFDTASGHLIGTVDGVLLTALRTGAASALASKFLADPASKTLGLIGCGTQAVTQLHAISRIFKLEEVLIHDISADAMFSFKERISMLKLDAEIIPSQVNELVAKSDILVTSTTIEVGEGPLFGNVETKPHLHVNAVGSDFPGKFELPIELLKKSFVCPDFPEQAKLEGECQRLKPPYIGPGWVEIIQNTEDYQHLKSLRTVFDSTGWPLEDLVVMELFLEYGREMNLGEHIAIEHLSEDVKSPYHFLNKLGKPQVTKRK